MLLANPTARRRWRAEQAIVLAIAIVASQASLARALITGGEGNAPIDGPGWPKGAAAIFNHPARVAWWEGPPFGGGQWHAECRGDAQALNVVLDCFAKLDVKSKRLVVHDGVGHSFWLNANREAGKEAAARIDWIFVVWQPDSWERLQKMPAGLRPRDAGGADNPPASIDVYTGGNVNWDDVVVPPEIEVVDERLVAHGFVLDDGAVLEGRVVDLADNHPLAARVELQRIEPQNEGGYRYTAVSAVEADAHGRWVMKRSPVGWFRIVAHAEGYVSRIAGHVQLDDQPGWRQFACGLSVPGPVVGLVVDEDAQPLSDVQVRLDDVTGVDEQSYESPDEYITTTDAEGRFQLDQVPIGFARIWLNKSGYCVLGLGRESSTPAGVALKMTRSARIQVTVDFSNAKRPDEYLVEIEPEGGSTVGSWGGSARIDDKNQYAFTDVPPGRYVLKGKPNPSRETDVTKPIVIELRGGEDLQIKLDPNQRE